MRHVPSASLYLLRMAKGARDPQASTKRLRERFPFAKGLLRCAQCGEAMVSHTTTSGHESYICRTRKATHEHALPDAVSPAQGG
jgi:hypothetical protein